MTTSRMREGGRAVFRGWVPAVLFLALGFAADAVSGGDNAAFVSYSGVPARMTPGSSATVTVTMRNNGATTWETTTVTERTQQSVTTTRTSYSLDAVGHGWGVGGVAVTGSVAPNAARSFRFTITAPSTTGSYTFRWQMFRHTVVTNRPIIAGTAFGRATPARTIVVAAAEPDTAPSFGNQEIPYQHWLTGTAVDLALPAATGGNGNRSYALTCSLPRGVTFNRTRKRISGTPRTVWGPTSCTWKVTDSDNNRAESDADKLTFWIRARRPGLVVNPDSLTDPAIAEGGSRNFTVKLAARPTGTVAVSVSRGSSVVDLGVTSLTFSTSNWNRTQSVKVTGAEDDDASDESTTIDLSASGGGYGNVSSSVAVSVTDNDKRALIVEPARLSVREGRSGTYTVKLATRPTGNVTVSITGMANGVGVDDSSLAFNTSNWNDAQTVTVSAAEDDNAISEEVTLTNTPSGADYDRVDAKTVEVTKTDPDRRALVVSKSSLPVAEGGSGSYTVALATEPTGPVTVTISGMAKGIGVDASSLTFDASDWNDAQTVTVLAGEDDNAVSEEVTLTNAASGADYGSVDAKTVEVTSVENDARAIVVSKSTLPVAEGGSGSYTVALATEPTGPVTVTISGMANGVSVDDSSLTFDASDWNDAQTVTVSAAEDDNAVSETATLTHTPSGADYGSVPAKTVGVTTEDNDTKALVVSKSSLLVAEGGSGTYTVKLATRPTGSVSVAITGMANGVDVDDSSLTFDASNWNDAQTVTVSAAEDDNAVSETVTLTHTPSGGGYGSVVAKTVEVTTEDNDTKALVLSKSSLPVTEGGTGTYTVKLATRPTGSVSVPISGMAKGVSVDVSSLTFSTSNWNDAQTVTVSAAEDDNAVSETVTLTHTPSGGDYGSVAAKTVEVTTEDNDTKALVLSKSSLPVAEGGSGTYTVKLATRPTGSVSVTISGMAKGVSVDVSSLTFSTSNWNDAQTVTVSAAEDDNAVPETVTLTHAPSGGGYGSVVAKTVEVTTEDNDTKALVVSKSSLSVAEGGTGTFSVALATLPAGNVTVSVSSGDTAAATASPASLSFTAADYGTSQTVTVTGVQDADVEDENTSIGLSASGGDYGSVSASVAVTVNDDDEEDTAPSFADDARFPDQSLTQGEAMPPATGPEATGGNGARTYSLSPAPPAGLSFDNSTRVLSGTPSATQAATTYTYTAADSDDNTAPSDTASLTFTIAVSAADRTPSFGEEEILDQTWVKNRAIGTLTLPAATGGDGELRYTLSGTLPPGVTFNSTTRTLSGTPTKKQAATSHTYTATDEDGDTATLSFTIRVEGKSSDGASFVSYADVPSSMAAGSSATVTVRMRNAGTTTWTPGAGYKLGSQRPENNTTWGLSRVSLPSDTVPNATVDFTFRITAPSTVGSHKFRWRMLKGESGWFGGKTTTVGIAVETDVSPSFGEARIPARTWVKNVAIAPLTLPAASGGNGRLTYSVTGTLPPGVTFDSSTRVLSGTPTKRQAATTYTYTATDADGDAATLSFTIRVDGKASDGASFVSYTNVPTTMAAGSSAEVTVRMRNAGTTTWTSGAGYKLGSQRPRDNTTWGLSRVSLSSDVAPNAEADFTFTITAPATVGNHNFRWRMLKGTDGWFGDKTALQSIAVEADVSPSFGSETISDRTWVKNVAISTSTLPAATGGNGTVTYSLTPSPPAGVTFDSTARTLSGTPTKKQAATTYSYAATDQDGDTATLSFTIRVDGKASDGASFVSYADVPSKIVAGGTATVTVRMKNTGSTTWTSAGGYKLGSQRPDKNTTWGLSEVSLASDVAPNATANFTFTITAPTTTGNHNFRWRMLTGTNGWFGDKTALQAIAVEDPSFGDATVADRAWTAGTPIEALVLPEASGTGGALTYSLTPSLPAGVTFTESTRTLAGTPSAAQAETWYTYKATDPGDDAATLSFRIRVTAAPRDDAAFVSYSGVPSKIHAGGTATVTVRMRNTGTTTWTSSGGYRLGSQSPGDNTRWGSSRISPPSDVAPNAEADFTFAITAPETTGGHAFAWRMVRDASTWFGGATTSRTITVEDPSFGDASVADQAWTQDTAIATLTLPAASGGDGTLTYSLSPDPPAGVTFDATARTLSGTPTASQAATTYTYTATDSDSDAATLTFEIRVAAAPRDGAAFVSSSGVPSKIHAGGTATVTVTMRNTGTTTWTSAGGYKLGSQSPADNTTWGSSRVSLPSDVAPDAEASFTFTITAPDATGGHVFAWQMVRDPSSWFGAAAASATITVEDPSFGDAAIADQTWYQYGRSSESVTLPAASGGDGTLTYSLSPAPPAGMTFDATARTLSGSPTEWHAAKTYTYTATDSGNDTATLTFSMTVIQGASLGQSASSSAAPPAPGGSIAESSSAHPPGAPGGVFDMFEYWLPPRGGGAALRARLGDGRTVPAGGGFHVRSVWRGDLWGRKVALLGDPDGARYDIFEEAGDGLNYWGTFEGAAGAGGDRPSSSLDRPFRWMNRFMAVGDAVEGAVAGHLLSGRGRNREGVFEATMRLEIVSHRESFAVPGGDNPAADDLVFEDVLEVRFWPDAARSEVHDTFFLARGFGAVHYRRSAAASPGEVVEWWAVEDALRPVGRYAPSMPWFDPFSPGWPKTAVLNGNLEDAGNGVEGARVGSPHVPGWAADSADAVLSRPPAGLDAGAWSLRLRGSASGGDAAPDAAVTREWIPVEGGTYRLSACMTRENAGDDVLVDFDDGKGRDADFADVHLVATSTGAWECRAVTKCIPGSVGAVRVRAVRDGANLGDAWFDRIELQRIAACEGER